MSIASSVVQLYKKIFTTPNMDWSLLGTPCFPIPKYSEEELTELSYVCSMTLMSDETLLRLNGEYTIVGDVHGNLRDLLRIFSSLSNISVQKFIFLGDYVDRGEFSMEVLTLLFSLKITFPENIYLLRGNHEFTETNLGYGFKREICDEYSEQLYNQICVVFDFLPLAAVLNNDIFIVHGGIGPTLKTIEQIDNIKRPFRIENAKKEDLAIVTEIVWSDPMSSVDMFVPSLRGQGYFFGRLAHNQFMKQNGIKKIIRGHQCVAAGVEIPDHFTNIITVFSSSYYASSANKCGIVTVTPENHLLSYQLEAIPQMTRKDTTFQKIDITDLRFKPKARKINSLATFNRISFSKKRRSTSEIVHLSPKLERKRSCSPACSCFNPMAEIQIPQSPLAHNPFK